MPGLAHERDGAEPLPLKRTRQKAERVRRDNRACAGATKAQEHSSEQDFGFHFSMGYLPIAHHFT